MNLYGFAARSLHSRSSSTAALDGPDGPLFCREAFGGSVASSLVATSGSSFKWLRHRRLRDFRHAVASAPLFRAKILSPAALRVALRPPVAKAEYRLHGKKRGESEKHMNTMTMTHVTTACTFCHETSIVELNEAEARRWRAGTPIQDAMPDRPAAERELIRSGIHPTCWTDAFGPAD